MKPSGVVWRRVGSAESLDVQRVEGFLGKLADLRTSGFVDDASDLNRYGVSPAVGTISVWALPGPQPQRLLVGRALEGSTNRYGRLEARNVIVQLPSAATELLTATPEQFRPLASPSAPGTPQSPKTTPASLSPVSKLSTKLSTVKVKGVHSP